MFNHLSRRPQAGARAARPAPRLPQPITPTFEQVVAGGMRVLRDDSRSAQHSRGLQKIADASLWISWFSLFGFWNIRFAFAFAGPTLR